VGRQHYRGSRYTTGIEDHPEEAADTKFQFQFINNFYINPNATKPDIEAVLKHGIIDRLQVYIRGNLSPHRPVDTRDQLAGVHTEFKNPIEFAVPDIRGQISEAPLFAAPVPITVEDAMVARERVVQHAGCSHHRDAVDKRILENVTARRFGRIVISQDDVGGWPELNR
jgi:hypothetical protein